MQTKQLKPATLYALIERGRRGGYTWNKPAPALALGPLPIKGPETDRFGRKIDKNDHDYREVDPKRADGVAVLVEKSFVTSEVERALRDSRQLVSDEVREYVQGVYAAFKEGSVQLFKIDVPEGWEWQIVKPAKIAALYEDEMKVYDTQQQWEKDKREREENRKQTNKARLGVLRDALEAKGFTQGKVWPAAGLYDVTRSDDPDLRLPMSVLEKLLGIGE